MMKMEIGLPQLCSLVPAHADKGEIERSATRLHVYVCARRDHVPVGSHFTNWSRLQHIIKMLDW